MSGLIVEFMQDNLPQIAWLLEENLGKARLLLPNRREMNIPSTRLLPWQGPRYASEKSKDEIIPILQGHKDSRENFEKEIDLLSLWEMTQGEMHEESAIFFAELMHTDAHIDMICAYAHALLKCKTHFKFQNPLFEIFTKDVVDAKLEAQNNAKEKEHLLGTAANFFNFLWELHKKELMYDDLSEQDKSQFSPDALDATKLSSEIEELLKNLLLQRIRDPESHDNATLWKQITKQLPDDPHLALLLAITWGLLPYHYNYWLCKADFEPSPLFKEWTYEKKEEVENIIQKMQNIEACDKTKTLRDYSFATMNPLQNSTVSENSIQHDECTEENPIAHSRDNQIHTQTHEDKLQELSLQKLSLLEATVQVPSLQDKLDNKEQSEKIKNTPLNLSALSGLTSGLGSFTNLATSHKNKQNTQKKKTQNTEAKLAQINKKIPLQKEEKDTQKQSTAILTKKNSCDVQASSTPHKILSPIFSHDENNKTQAIENFFKPFLEQSFISIDGATTKDIDDAFTLTRLENGDYEIFIALACPACIWEFNSAFDKEIFHRTTSLYLPEATYHMMPHSLSTELFSLKEKHVRPALVCKSRVSPTGEILESSFDFMRVQIADNLHYDACEHLLSEKLMQAEHTQNGEDTSSTNHAHIVAQSQIDNDSNIEDNEDNEEMEFLMHMENFEQNSLEENTKLRGEKQNLAYNACKGGISQMSNIKISPHDIFHSKPSEQALTSAKKHEECLKHAYEFAKARLSYRISQGSVIIEKDEMHIRLENPHASTKNPITMDEDTECAIPIAIDKNTEVYIDYVPQNPKAQLIVSELMILANASVAHFATKHEMPLFFRTQDLALPKEYAGIWRKPEEIAKIARSMSAAKTSTSPRPHAGLALQEYSPVTSPLRRYADLVNEAQLLRYVYSHFYEKKNNSLSTKNNIQIKIDYSPLLWDKSDLDRLLFDFTIHNELVTQVQRMRPRYWRFVAIEQEAKRQNTQAQTHENCGFHAIISDENDNYVTVTLTREQLIVRGKRHLFGDKALLGQEVMVRLGKINPLRSEMTILAVHEC